MRVLHLMTSNTAIYGAERVLLDELAALRCRGVDVHFLMIRELRQGVQADLLATRAAALGVPVVVVPSRGRISWSLVARTRDAIRQVAPHLLHTHGYKADVIGLAAGRLARVPVLGEAHGWLLLRHQPLNRFYEWLDLQAFKRMDGVIALSEHYRRLLCRLGVAAARVSLIPSGVDAPAIRARAGRIDLRQRLGLPPNCPTVGMLSRLSHEKGVDIFLEAMAGVLGQVPEARAIICGSGPLLRPLQQQARRLGIAAAISWPGYVEESVDALLALDVLALTSRIEALPQVLMESMALGRPAVVTPVGGCPEVVVNGRTGIVVPDHEPARIAAAISRLLLDPEERTAMGRDARRRLEEEYAMDRWFSRTMACYTATAHRSGRQHRRDCGGDQTCLPR